MSTSWATGKARRSRRWPWADLDPLPIDDEKDVTYRSSIPGVAHACGHDVHTAVVLGAGLGLARFGGCRRTPGPGTVGIPAG